jgi:uncharacterized protein (DUF1501 family)
MDRRFFLRGTAILGCSAAAHPFLSTVTLAAADGGQPLGDHRLVVIILRGAMDGLDVLQPQGDPLFASYRPTLAGGEGATDLDGYFALHARLGALLPLWQAGELAFAHAVSTPYRDQRSHFDGQDMLEAGTGLDVPLGAARDGWLNRLLQAVPGLKAETAYAIGREAVPLLAGEAPMRSWEPNTALEMSSQNRLLLEAIYHDDALFRDASAEAMELAAMMGTAGMDGAVPKKGNDAAGLAEVDALVDFAAGRLREDTRIAAFSQNGWDTHRGQEASIGRSLTRLERTILRLKEQLGDVWGKTTVLAMTEFGRTVRENGTKGTDHGTGGLLVMAGGAIRGSKVYGRWPGLAEADLYDQRDLMPTSDVRAWAAWAMAGAYGLDAAVLEGSVFPGLDLGENPKFML